MLQFFVYTCEEDSKDEFVNSLTPRLKDFCESILSSKSAGSKEEEISVFERHYQEYTDLKGVKIVDFCRKKGIDVVAFREYRRKRLND